MIRKGIVPLDTITGQYGKLGNTKCCRGCRTHEKIAEAFILERKLVAFSLSKLYPYNLAISGLSTNQPPIACVLTQASARGSPSVLQGKGTGNRHGAADGWLRGDGLWPRSTVQLEKQ